MLPVFLALLASAAANPDPIKLFETISAPELDIQSSAGLRSEAASGIRSVLMDQGVALAETTFDSSLEKSRCMARELCKFGANRDTEFAPAVSAFTDFLMSMKATTERETDNIDHLLGSVEVGKMLGAKHCDTIYSCARKPNRGRVDCQILGNICPGLAMSCTMCGIFAPAVCGPSCTFAGLYCGVSGYTC